MLSAKASRYMRGYVNLCVKSAMPEKFINLCMQSNIYLWNIVRKGNFLYVSINLKDIYQLHTVTRRTRSKIHITGRRGLPFFLAKLRKRKMLISGAVLFFVILYILSSFVWFISVQGNQKIQSDIVLENAKQCGLRLGVAKDKIDVRKLERDLLLQLPDIAWVGITFRGTQAVIEIAEKTVLAKPESAPAHIVASKDGLITEIIVLAGQPAVKKGDMIRKNDILIKGIAVEPPKVDPKTGNPLITLPGKLLHAKGIAKARVWYEGYGEARFTKEIKEPTGNVVIGVVFHINDHTIVIKHDHNIPFQEYTTKEVRKGLTLWRNHGFTVESIIRLHQELNIRYLTQDADQVLREAKEAAWASLQKQIPENAQIVERKLEIIKLDEPGVVRVKMVVETIEDIGAIYPIQ